MNIIFSCADNKNIQSDKIYEKPWIRVNVLDLTEKVCCNRDPVPKQSQMEVLSMHDNRNLNKTHDISNAEMRKMFPKDGADIGIINGDKTGSKEHKFTKRSKLSHNK